MILFFDCVLALISLSPPLAGIMDNAILIIAGDAIDTSLGVTLGISTMCAAAIGNIISDVAGIMLGTIIEDFTARLGLPAPNVSAAQRQLRSVRFAGQFGTLVGVGMNCHRSFAFRNYSSLLLPAFHTLCYSDWVYYWNVSSLID